MRQRIVRRFWRDRRAVSAVEFALVFPVLLVVFLGGSELAIALTVDRKVRAAMGYATDLVSQSTQLSETDLKKLFSIAKGSLPPYSITPLDMRVTQIKIDEHGKATVDWSCRTNGYDALAPGTVVSPPAQLTSDARQVWSRIALKNALLNHDPSLDHDNLSDTSFYVIWGQAKYKFQPITGQAISQTVNLTGEQYILPRYSNRVDSNGCSPFTL